MTAVARPRNNLQQHLAWFNSQKPHIPPQGQQVEYAQASLANAVVPISTGTVNPQVQMPDSYPPVQREPSLSVSTQSVARNPNLLMPRKTAIQRQQEEVEVVATEETPLPNIVREGAMQRIKQDTAHTGMS